MNKMNLWFLGLFYLAAMPLFTQTIHDYTVMRTDAALVIDGRLDEAEWQSARLTESFVYYRDGSRPVLNTQAKMLWDSMYWYIGFICEDPDVWATLTQRDDHLWNGEVIEILCDPDGDGLNYFELQVNPLNTLLDLLMNKPYSEGGSADFSFHLEKIQTGVWVNGTLNDSSDVDSAWTCEVAIPFDEVAFCCPEITLPPAQGDTLRILLTRYDYERKDDQTVEITAWNQTDNRGFHVPEKFGYAAFSEGLVTACAEEMSPASSDRSFQIVGNYPNPFNPETRIVIQLPRREWVRIEVYNVRGNPIRLLFEGSLAGGRHVLEWDGKDTSGRQAPTGVYLVRMEGYDQIFTNRLLKVH